MITYETLKTFCATNTIHPVMNYACRRTDGWWATDGHRVICVPMEECQQGDLRFLCDEMPDNVGRFPNVEAVVDVKGFATKFSITVQAINDALAKLPLTDETVEVEREMKFLKCPQCGGSGDIDISESIYFNNHWYHAEATVDCPICHGYGQIPDKEDYDPKKEDYDPESPEYSTKVKTGKKIPDVDGALLHIKDNAYIQAAYALGLLRVAREQGVEQIECSGSDYRKILVFRMNGVIVGIMPFFNDGSIKSIEIKV